MKKAHKLFFGRRRCTISILLPLYDCISPAGCRSKFSLPLIPIRLLALELLILFPLKHPAIDRHPWLRVSQYRIVRHTPAMLATVETDLLAAPRIAFNRIAFHLDFIFLVVCPERTVASTDGAEAFVGWLAKGWKGDADGFAVACYCYAILL
jgi:membrane-anchored protein YejM (alkaline phosphatase superfamily)